MTGWLGLLRRGGVLQDGAGAKAVASFVVGEERVGELAAWFERIPLRSALPGED